MFHQEFGTRWSHLILRNKSTYFTKHSNFFKERLMSLAFKVSLKKLPGFSSGHHLIEKAENT